MRICCYHTANLNFLFMSLYVFLFTNGPSQFLSHWESAEPVFCSEELSSLPCKNKSLTQLFGGKIQICSTLRTYTHYTSVFFQRATFKQTTIIL